MAARVLDIRPLGATVRVELERSDDQSIVEVELIRDRFNSIDLGEGDDVFLQPKKLRLFDQNTRVSQ